MKTPKMWLQLKPSQEIWLHLNGDANKASINLGIHPAGSFTYKALMAILNGQERPPTELSKDKLKPALEACGWIFVASHDNPLTNSAVPDCWIHDDHETAWSEEEAIVATLTRYAHRYGMRATLDDKDRMLAQLDNECECLRVAIADEEANKWQPIETAPKDGTQILAWYSGLGSTPVQTWWLSDAKHWYLSGNPTHWRHLPKPPCNMIPSEPNKPATPSANWKSLTPEERSDLDTFTWKELKSAQNTDRELPTAQFQ